MTEGHAVNSMVTALHGARRVLEILEDHFMKYTIVYNHYAVHLKLKQNNFEHKL